MQPSISLKASFLLVHVRMYSLLRYDRTNWGMNRFCSTFEGIKSNHDGLNNTMGKVMNLSKLENFWANRRTDKRNPKLEEERTRKRKCFSFLFIYIFFFSRFPSLHFDSGCTIPSRDAAAISGKGEENEVTRPPRIPNREKRRLCGGENACVSGLRKHLLYFWAKKFPNTPSFLYREI